MTFWGHCRGAHLCRHSICREEKPLWVNKMSVCDINRPTLSKQVHSDSPTALKSKWRFLLGWIYNSESCPQVGTDRKHLPRCLPGFSRCSKTMCGFGWKSCPRPLSPQSYGRFRISGVGARMKGRPSLREVLGWVESLCLPLLLGGLLLERWRGRGEDVHSKDKLLKFLWFFFFSFSSSYHAATFSLKHPWMRCSIFTTVEGKAWGVWPKTVSQRWCVQHCPYCFVLIYFTSPL